MNNIYNSFEPGKYWHSICLTPVHTITLNQLDSNVSTQQQFVNTLHKLIQDGDEVDRCYAIRSLATINDQHSTALLIDRLRDDDIDVCVDAAEALGKLGGNGASEKLLESLLNDPEGEVKTACIRALSTLGDRNTIPHFISMAEQRPDSLGYDSNEWDAWWDIQLEAIKALGAMQAGEAIPAFKRILEQDDYLDIENELYQALVKIGHEGDSLLLSVLESGSSRARRRVIKALGHSTAAATLKPLARGLQDNDPDIRIAVLKSLPLRAHAVSYLPIIFHLLKDEQPEVRRTAIEAVSTLSKQIPDTDTTDGQAALLEKLLPLLQDSDVYVQASVIDTLLQLSWIPERKHCDQIISMLADSRGDAFTAACNFISKHQLVEALPDILQLFKKRKLDFEEKAYVLRTLGELGEWNAKIDTLLSVQLFDDNKSVRLAALEALAILDKNLPQPVLNASKGDAELSDSMPIEKIIQALQGELETPVTRRPIPVTTVEAVPTSRLDETAIAGANALAEKQNQALDVNEDVNKEEAKTESPQDATFVEDEFVENAFNEISKSISKGEIPQPMSTLDSMAITCVEHELKAAEKLPLDIPEQPSGLTQEEKEELKEFLELSEANAKTAKWLFSKEKVSLEVDIQRLAARMMAAAKPEKAIPSLLKVYAQSNDIALKTEIIVSLGRLVDKPSRLPTEQLAEILQIFNSALQAADRNQRIAAARSLGRIGNDQSIQKLVAGLEDEEVAMRVACLDSIHTLIEKHADMNLDYVGLAGQILQQFENNEVGVHRAAISALLPLLNNKLNGDTQAVKETAIDRFIEAGLAGTDGQVREMSSGLNALDQSLSSERLLTRLESCPSSIERRYVLEMLGELHRQ